MGECSIQLIRGEKVSKQAIILILGMGNYFTLVNIAYLVNVFFA